jgi:large conductance mechanosensitive channel
MGFIQEFKEFAVKGNAIDMAVGIVIGAAFNKIVSSLVNDIIMPPLGILIADVDFKEWAIPLNEAVFNDDGTVAKAAVTLNIGSFINTLIEFIIIAFSVFVAVKVMNKLIRQRQAEPAT